MPFRPLGSDAWIWEHPDEVACDVHPPLPPSLGISDTKTKRRIYLPREWSILKTIVEDPSRGQALLTPQPPLRLAEFHAKGLIASGWLGCLRHPFQRFPGKVFVAGFDCHVAERGGADKPRIFRSRAVRRRSFFSRINLARAVRRSRFSGDVVLRDPAGVGFCRISPRALAPDYVRPAEVYLRTIRIDLERRGGSEEGLLPCEGAK